MSRWFVGKGDEIHTLYKKVPFYYFDDEVAYHFWTGEEIL
jgi:hypothetical protein